MTKQDLIKLWDMLDYYYPTRSQARPNRDSKTINAWMLILEPYSYADIEQAAFSHVRKSDYYPTISNITSLLPPPPAPETKPKFQPGKWELACVRALNQSRQETEETGGDFWDWEQRRREIFTELYTGTSARSLDDG